MFIRLAPSWLKTMRLLIGTPRAGVVVTAVVVGAKVNCLAAKCAAVVDKRLMLLDAHCDGQVAAKGLCMEVGMYVCLGRQRQTMCDI